MLSPIAHEHSLDSHITSAPVPTTSFDLDSDNILLESLLNRSSFRSTLPDSTSSDYTFYAKGEPVGPTLASYQTPVPDRCFRREGPFVARIPHPRIGDPNGECTFQCKTYRESDFAHPSAEFGLPLHHPRFLEWVGASESARLLDRGPVAAFGRCPVHSPLMRRASCIVMWSS